MPGSIGFDRFPVGYMISRFNHRLIRGGKRQPSPGALGLIIFGILLMLLAAGCDALPATPQSGDEDGRPEGEFILPDPPRLPAEAGSVRIGTLFYPDTLGRFLVPITMEIPWTEGIARITLQKLVPSSGLSGRLNELGLAAVLPAGVEILGIAINEGLARIDLSDAFLEYPPEQERLVLGSILCTLRQFSTIEQVEIVVDGESVDRFPGGTPGKLPLGPECWINLEIESDVDDYREYSAVKLFFCYPAPCGLIFYVPVTRVLLPVDDLPTAVVEELLEGPRRGSGLFSEIPPETVLLSIKQEDGLITLNLSGHLLDCQGGKTGAENIVNQILLTLSALENVRQVQILVEGDAVSFGHWFDLTNPLEPPQVFNFVTFPGGV
ncbi:MAG: GerMN domain-containing protein [Bacillota bacterium]